MLSVIIMFVTMLLQFIEGSEFLQNNYNLSLIKEVPDYNLICFTKLYGVTYRDRNKDIKFKGLWLKGSNVPIPVIVSINDDIEIEYDKFKNNLTLSDGIVYDKNKDYCKMLEELTLEHKENDEVVGSRQKKNLLGRMKTRKSNQDTCIDKRCSQEHECVQIDKDCTECQVDPDIGYASCQYDEISEYHGYQFQWCIGISRVIAWSAKKCHPLKGIRQCAS
ncbi:hypothetical protein FOB58_005266 [Candida parapsilosis]|uniref:Uncharacterized protein n=2 Tax=Candida parapsilosis TaxID=5480 RepID=G8B592_CANPC|nr:uncharacterized protein CPAR2_602030 [Candida parapsilosis]KAF6043551.1 hypothetical protein FOB58_005266 [Candida parapsilosis]KAF6043951.1 hypothetical protein FOB59_004907 [Candida parapsilosis]KAF6045429.1 hypothetical protein FOB60_005001 [Candida parapsilosis]KAF6060215.1 hypothetical protein FOB61_005230 [Candida parapsilosis]CAD1813572.1 unnamed protein product [Candida parapsilosis]